MYEIMDNIEKIREFINERIKTNKELFTDEEIKFIKDNEEYVYKIYLLGFIDAKDCYDTSE